MLTELRKQARAVGMSLHPAKTQAFYLKGYGFSPATVFDVGVFDGTPWLYQSFPNAKLVLVDPQSRPGALPENASVHNVALGAETGRMTLNIPETKPGKGGAMASLLKRQDGLVRTFTREDKIDVEVMTLDALASAYQGPFGIKIDTEGFEAQVLAGAKATLKDTQFVILELSVTPRFEQIAPPSGVIATMAAAGLEFRDVLAVADGPGKRARPRHMDVLFTRWPA